MTLPLQPLRDSMARTVTVASQGRTVRDLLAALDRLDERGLGGEQVEVRDLDQSFGLTVVVITEVS